jgi:hypothetical protein
MERPLFIFALNADIRVHVATIVIMQHANWGGTFQPIGIFENQEEIGQKVLARFTDHCEVVFPNLVDNKERIADYIRRSTIARST